MRYFMAKSSSFADVECAPRPLRVRSRFLLRVDIARSRNCAVDNRLEESGEDDKLETRCSEMEREKR